MATTRLSSKGQLVIPKEVRDRHGWREGTELEVEDKGGGVVVLRPKKPWPPSRIEDVSGCLKYDGPPVSIEDMTGSDEAAVEMWEEFERRSR